MNNEVPFCLKSAVANIYEISSKKNHNGTYVFLKYKDALKNSDKFWGAIVDANFEVITFWGRNGYSPQNTKKIDFSSLFSIVNEKKRKGYEFVEDNLLLDMFFESPNWFKKIADDSFGGGFKSCVERQVLEKTVKKENVQARPRLKI